jgi:F-box-like
VHADRNCRGSNKVEVSDDRQVTSCQWTITEWGGTDQVYPRVTFGALPDDVLLEIFNFYLAIMVFEPSWFRPFPEDAWHMLVHVCKRWRSIVFASPHRLKLQLLCTNKRPVQHMPDIWPELPIVISGGRGLSERRDANNIIAALTQHDRVVKIDMDEIPNSFLTRMAAETSNPFSMLTSLQLIATRRDAPAFPDSFLGGSAPRLQTLTLTCIPFPALPNLLLSTHDLVALRLWNIPISGYFSPEALVTCLPALTRLETLRLGFQSPRSQADRENRLVSRLSRLVLPALTKLSFKGDSEYLEDIVAQIDTPLLTRFKIRFFNQLIFHTPSLRDFIRRTETFKAPDHAQVVFREYEVGVELYLRTGDSFHKILSLEILCSPSDWQLSSVAQVCDSALSRLPTLECLEIYIKRSWEDDVENAQWLELLHPFTFIKDLHHHERSSLHSAMEQLAGGRITEALPALDNLFLDVSELRDPVKKAIGKFVAARRLSGRHVAVHRRDRPHHKR